MRDVLMRPLSRGEIVWNQTRKRDRWGQTHVTDRPQGDWLRVPAPELAIVPPNLWQDAHARFAERQRKHTTTGRRRQQDVDSAYLLSGFARCGSCGGGLATHSRRHGKQPGRTMFYGCTSFWKRGAKVCGNNMMARMDVLDAEVLATLKEDVCRPAVIEEAIRLALEDLAAPAANCHELEAELATARQECERLADAIACGGPLDTLVKRLAARQARCEQLEQQLAMRAADRPPVNLAGMERRLRTKLADWRGLLHRNVEDGRSVLRALLVGPLKFTPVDDGRRRGYAFEGTIALDRLVAGAVDLPTKVASPPGFESSVVDHPDRVRGGDHPARRVA